MLNFNKQTGVSYVSPEVELTELLLEKGFAESDIENLEPGSGWDFSNN